MITSLDHLIQLAGVPLLELHYGVNTAHKYIAIIIHTGQPKFISKQEVDDIAAKHTPVRSGNIEVWGLDETLVVCAEPGTLFRLSLPSLTAVHATRSETLGLPMRTTDGATVWKGHGYFIVQM